MYIADLFTFAASAVLCFTAWRGLKEITTFAPMWVDLNRIKWCIAMVTGLCVARVVAWIILLTAVVAS